MSAPAPDLTFTITQKFCPGRVADLLCTAFEGGMTSAWACKVGSDAPTEVVELPNWDDGVYPNYHWPLSPGGAVYLQEVGDDGYDTDDEDYYLDKDGVRLPVHKLDLEAIKRGLELFTKPEHSHQFSAWVDEQDDAITGDYFLQLCLFGECRYG